MKTWGGANNSPFCSALQICSRTLQSQSDQSGATVYAKKIITEELAKSPVNATKILDTHDKLVDQLAVQLKMRSENLASVQALIEFTRGALSATQRLVKLQDQLSEKSSEVWLCVAALLTAHVTLVQLP